jgi:hypothetical protein
VQHDYFRNLLFFLFPIMRTKEKEMQKKEEAILFPQSSSFSLIICFGIGVLQFP